MSPQTANQIEVVDRRLRLDASRSPASIAQLDLFVQNQLRTETGGGAYADQTSNILGQLQSVYGTPGGTGTLETALNNFTTALQALSTNPGSSSAQTSALSMRRRSLAQQLNATTQGIQSLRSNVEQDIGNSVNQANTDMSQIAAINTPAAGPAARPIRRPRR